MAARVPYKPITIRPIDGLLDTRLTPDEIPIGGYRYVESWECLARGKLCRMSGWRRLLDEEFNNNADLHDQLLTITEREVRQPIIFLFTHPMPLGTNKFYAASANVLYALNNGTGNWKVIGDEFSPAQSASCPEVRWSAAGFGDVVVFSNGIDPVVYQVVDQPALGDTDQSVQTISDLELLNITRVGFVKQFAGLTIYFNVVQDAVRHSYRAIWSDYQNPLSVKPKASASVAGYKDLDFGEVILAAEELGNSLVVYTNKAIWQADLGGDAGLIWSKRYSPKDVGDRCLVYPRTLVSTGSEHYFFARDGIYLFSQYVAKPQRIEWIHNASAIVFEDLDSSRCVVHHGAHEVDKKQIWWSWAKTGEACPTQSFVINTEYSFASLVPKGFSAFGLFGFIRQRILRDFLIEKCICDAAGLEENGLGFVHEGGFCAAPADCTGCDADTESDCEAPTSIYTNETVDLDGVEVEDLNFGGGNTPDAQSLCTALAGLTVQDLCQVEAVAAECKDADLFIGASTEDFCLKEMDSEVRYRERCSDMAGCGTYIKDGYLSILRSGPLDLGLPEQEKRISRFGVEIHPEEQSVPSQLELKVGSAVQAIDPNKFDENGRCVIMYREEVPRSLECLSTKTAVEHAEAGTRPDEDVAWTLDMIGRYFYFELTVSNPNVSPPNTGGAVCLSRISFRAGAAAMLKM